MREPATHINPEVERVDSEIETAIEETRRFLEVNSWFYWEADPDNELVSPLRAKIRKVEALDIPDQIKNLAVWNLFEKARKRRRKPRRRFRNLFIQVAASRLAERGFKRTRNDETFDKESATSIIREALRRLGVEMKEKQIRAIVLK